MNKSYKILNEVLISWNNKDNTQEGILSTGDIAKNMEPVPSIPKIKKIILDSGFLPEYKDYFTPKGDREFLLDIDIIKKVYKVLFNIDYKHVTVLDIHKLYAIPWSREEDIPINYNDKIFKINHIHQTSEGTGIHNHRIYLYIMKALNTISGGFPITSDLRARTNAVDSYIPMILKQYKEENFRLTESDIYNGPFDKNTYNQWKIDTKYKVKDIRNLYTMREKNGTFDLFCQYIQSILKIIKQYKDEKWDKEYEY